MTNINCSKNCVYQQDGKCGYDNVILQKTQINSGDVDCAYQVAAPQQTIPSNDSAFSDRG